MRLSLLAFVLAVLATDAGAVALTHSDRPMPRPANFRVSGSESDPASYGVRSRSQTGRNFATPEPAGGRPVGASPVGGPRNDD